MKLAAYYAWKRALEESFKAQEQELIERLKSLVPERAKKLFEAEWEFFLPKLLQHGEFTYNFRQMHCREYGCADLHELTSILHDLKVCWTGEVEMEVSPQTLLGHVKVQFSISEPPNDSKKIDLHTTTVHVQFNFEGNIVAGEIDSNELFMADIAYAVRDNSKNPVDVLAFLADEGARHGDRRGTSWSSRIGTRG